MTATFTIETEIYQSLLKEFNYPVDEYNRKREEHKLDVPSLSFENLTTKSRKIVRRLLRDENGYYIKSPSKNFPKFIVRINKEDNKVIYIVEPILKKQNKQKESEETKRYICECGSVLKLKYDVNAFIARHKETQKHIKYNQKLKNEMIKLRGEHTKAREKLAKAKEKLTKAKEEQAKAMEEQEKAEEEQAKLKEKYAKLKEKLAKK